MRIIGLDYGDSRIGVAVSDLLGWTAQPVCVLQEKTWAGQLDKLAEIVESYRSMDPRAQARIKGYIDALRGDI